MPQPRSVPPSRHPLVVSLWEPLLNDVQADAKLAAQVAVLVAAGLPRAEIARRLDATPAQLRIAYERLERVAPAIDREAA